MNEQSITICHVNLSSLFHNLVFSLHCISNSRHWIKSLNYPWYHYKFSLMKNQFYMDLTLHHEWKILHIIHESKPKSFRHKLDRFGPILTKPTCGKIWIWWCQRASRKFVLMMPLEIRIMHQSRQFYKYFS